MHTLGFLSPAPCTWPWPWLDAHPHPRGAAPRHFQVKNALRSGGLGSHFSSFLATPRPKCPRPSKRQRKVEPQRHNRKSSESPDHSPATEPDQAGGGSWHQEGCELCRSHRMRLRWREGARKSWSEGWEAGSCKFSQHRADRTPGSRSRACHLQADHTNSASSARVLGVLPRAQPTGMWVQCPLPMGPRTPAPQF